MTLDDAQKAARRAFLEARQNETEQRRLSDARRAARHARTPARLEGIRAADPDLADLIEADLEWLAQTTRGLQPLIGKTVAFLSDMRLGGMADGDAIAETLLRITGRDDVTADRKHKEAWEGRLATRFVVSSNVLPKLPDASPALANRFSVLRMQESFLGREDPGLADRLLGELPGILLWALEGWRRLRDRGRFVLPGTSEEAVQDLFNQGSDVAAFVHERCNEGPGYDVEKERLYALYREWCDRTGRKPKNDAAFATELYAATSNRVTPRRLSRNNERVNVYAGIKVRTGGAPPEEDEPY